jgi:signal transduction histidine kinase
MLLNKQVFILIFSALLGLMSSYTFAQKVCDCHISGLNENILKLNIRDYTEVFQFIKTIEKDEAIGCRIQKINLEFKLLLAQNQLDKALELLNEQENLLANEACGDKFLFDSFYNKTLYYKAINDFEKLSDFAFKALKEAEQLKDDEKEIKIIQEIVFLFTRMKENEKRWSYVKRAEKIILNQTNSLHLVYNYRWLGYQYENEYTKTERKTLIDSALVLIEKAKKDALKYEMHNEVAASYRGLEAISYHKGELNQALMYIDSAIFYAKKIKGTTILSGFYLSKAWDHYDLNQFEDASNWMDSSLFYDRDNDVAGHMMLLSEAAQIYEGSGKLDKAYNSFKLYSKLKDSILSKERLEVVNELDAKYQTELKDAQIKRLIILLIVSLLIIIVILFVTKMIQLKRTRQKNKELKQAFDKQISLEKELSNVRDNIAQDFHDDLGNKLARISLLSNLVADNLSDREESIKNKINQVKEDANSLFVGTKDFVFSLKSNSDYLEEVVTYLSDFGEDLFKNTTIKFVLQKELSINKKLPYYWSKQLIYIFKEAMTNALKHSKCSEVILIFKYQDNQLNIQCMDNGIGITDEQMESSNGIHNMKNRALKINGKLSIQSNEKSGTIVEFSGNTTQ